MIIAPVGAAFYDAVRPLFGGHLSQQQVDGIARIIEGWRREGDGSAAKLAYILATAKHETAHTMQPVKETGDANDPTPSDERVKARLTHAWAAGKMPWVTRDYWSEGWFGRGLVQLTHEDNYVRAGLELGVNLVANPDLALDPEISVRILIRGMLEGWFTTRRLGEFINGRVDFVNARRVVNGTDRASMIAEIAEGFLAALRADQNAAPDAPRPRPIDERPSGWPVKGAKDDEVVAQVQRRLRELGYVEVGNVDGDFGDFTETAILLFRHDNGLPLNAVIDDALMVALPKAPPRNLPGSRGESANDREVRQKVPEARDSWWSKVMGFWGMIGGGIATAAGWVSSSFDDARAAISPILGFFGMVPWWGYVALFVVGFGIVYVRSRAAEEGQIEAYRTGARR